MDNTDLIIENYQGKDFKLNVTFTNDLMNLTFYINDECYKSDNVKKSDLAKNDINTFDDFRKFLKVVFNNSFTYDESLNTFKYRSHREYPNVLKLFFTFKNIITKEIAFNLEKKQISNVSSTPTVTELSKLVTDLKERLDCQEKNIEELTKTNEKNLIINNELTTLVTKTNELTKLIDENLMIYSGYDGKDGLPIMIKKNIKCLEIVVGRINYIDGFDNVTLFLNENEYLYCHNSNENIRNINCENVTLKINCKNNDYRLFLLPRNVKELTITGVYSYRNFIDLKYYKNLETIIYDIPDLDYCIKIINNLYCYDYGKNCSLKFKIVGFTKSEFEYQIRNYKGNFKNISLLE